MGGMMQHELEVHARRTKLCQVELGSAGKDRQMGVMLQDTARVGTCSQRVRVECVCVCLRLQGYQEEVCMCVLRVCAPTIEQLEGDRDAEDRERTRHLVYYAEKERVRKHGGLEDACDELVAAIRCGVEEER